MKRIAIEEHFWTEETRTYLRSRKEYPRMEITEDVNHNKTERFIYAPNQATAINTEMGNRLLDTEGTRLKDMDENGITMQVLSVTLKLEVFGPDSITLARQTNNSIAKIAREHPERFSGLASLSLNDPANSTRELERAVKELNLKGAMLFSNISPGIYLDEPQYWSIFEMAEKLGVPLYIHPTNPNDDMIKPFLGYPHLTGSLWGYAADTGLCAMRLICSGVFDKFPGLTIILGHLGEAIPHWLWRIDNRWEKEHVASNPQAKKLLYKPGYYFKKNFYVTTSGMLSAPALLSTCMVLGAERILFAVDYPWESNKEAVDFIKTAPLSDIDKEKICHLNVEKLMKL